MDYICYRNLVDVCYSEDEVKLMAAEQDMVDGPNDEGQCTNITSLYKLCWLFLPVAAPFHLRWEMFRPEGWGTDFGHSRPKLRMCPSSAHTASPASRRARAALCCLH